MFPLLLAASDPDLGPVEAERAFARAAQRKGQWTAFREFMTDDAVMFTPEAVKAKDTLPIKNPPIAVQWWPAQSYVSCDRTVAVNTGPWVRPKSSGYFTTVWIKQPDGGWKWSLDHGDALAKPRALPEKPQVRIASCSGKQPMLAVPSGGVKGRGGGASPDRSLIWSWVVLDDGSRAFEALLWNGKRYEAIVQDQVAGPKQP